jgi:hypothetical protein
MSTRFMPRRATRLSVELGDFTLEAEATVGGFVLAAPAREGEAVSGTLRVGQRTFSFEGEVSWSEAASAWRAQPRTSVQLTRVDEGYFTALREAHST